MPVSDYTRIINEFRKLLLYISQLPTKKRVLEDLTQQDCKNLISAYVELGSVVKFIASKSLQEKKPGSRTE